MFYLTSGSSERNPSFEKKLSSVLLNLHSIRPRTFWRLLFTKKIFFQLVCIFSQNFSNMAKLFNRIVKMHFTCPEEHFYRNIMLTLWNNFGLWAMECRICGRKFGASLIKLLFCLQMGIWKNSFERNFTFSDFFLDVQGIFFGFFRSIIRGMVVQTAHHKPRGTYPLRKILWENFLSFPDYGRTFLNIHWSLLGMLSKLQFTCSQKHFEKGYFFRIFPNCCRTLSDYRPDLRRNF